MYPPIINKIIQTGSIRFDDLLSRGRGIYTFLNPVSYLEAIKRPTIYVNYDGIFADGNILVKAIKYLYRVDIHRMSFDMTSIVPILFNFAKERGKSIYIIGSEEKEMGIALEKFRSHFPGIIINGRNGYFHSAEEMDKEVELVINMNPDFLIIGMGAPQQEIFLNRIVKAGFNKIGFTCGGFIHQTAHDKIYYYPKWIDRFDLRFVYRFLKEKHTRKRYLIASILFPLEFIKEYVKFSCIKQTCKR